jgi:putative ABC transport system permease protein
MLLKCAFRNLAHERTKSIAAVGGVALAVFLVVLQCGFYFGFKRDISILICAIDGDVWVLPKHRLSFDTWDSIDDLAYFRGMSHPLVRSGAEAIWMYALWRNPKDGSKESVQILGFDQTDGIALRIPIRRFEPNGAGAALTQIEIAHLLDRDGAVVLNDRDQERLGIRSSTDVAEIHGTASHLSPVQASRVQVVGVCNGVHLFTQSSFIYTSKSQARTFLNIPSSSMSFAVFKCYPHADIDRVVRDLQASIPEHTVLSTSDWRVRAEKYWETRAGIGPILLCSSALAALVGFLTVMLTFSMMTVELLPVFAAMKALGAANSQVGLILVFEIGTVYLVGCLSAALGLICTIPLLEGANVSILISPQLVLGCVGGTALCSTLAGINSLLQILRVDPGDAFRS